MKYEGRVTMVGNFSEAFAGIFSGLLAVYSLRFPFYAQSGIAFIGIPAAMALTEHAAKTRIKNSFANIVKIIQYSLFTNKELCYNIMFSGVIGAATLTMAWFVQPLLIELDTPTSWFGIIWTILNLTVGISALYSDKLDQRLGSLRMYAFILFFIVSGYIAVAFNISYVGLICLFFFYILIVNATRSHADLQKGFSWLPGNYFLENLKSVANDGSFPMFRGILNSLIVSTCTAALCTYFSALTAYGLYAYQFKLKKVAFTFIMAILVMPTQVTAMGFLRLMTNIGLYDSLLPLILPSVASPAVFYFMYSYLESSLPLSLVEAARIDGSGEFMTFNRIVLPIMKPAVAVQAIFTFVGSWNNYFVPALIIQSKDKMTVPILIATLRGADYMNFDMGKIYMMIMVAIVPIIVVYLLLSKYIIAGITLGGVKE